MASTNYRWPETDCDESPFHNISRDFERREMCWNLPLGTLSQPERLCRNKKLSIHFSTNLFAGFAGLDFGACAGPLALVERRLLLCSYHRFASSFILISRSSKTSLQHRLLFLGLFCSSRFFEEEKTFLGGHKLKVMLRWHLHNSSYPSCDLSDCKGWIYWSETWSLRNSSNIDDLTKSNCAPLPPNTRTTPTYKQKSEIP